VKDLRGDAERDGTGSGRDCRLTAMAKRGQGAEDEADEDECDEDEDEGDGCGDVRLPSGEPCEEDGKRIFNEAERDVGERLRRRSDCGANGGFASVSNEGDGAARESGGKLFGGRERCSGLKSEERGEGDADESVERVPDEVEGGDLVDKETDAEEDESGGDDTPVGEEMKRGWQVEISGVGHEAERGHGGVDIEPGRETDGDHQGDDLVGWQGHGDSIEAGSERAS